MPLLGAELGASAPQSFSRSPSICAVWSGARRPPCRGAHPGSWLPCAARLGGPRGRGSCQSGE
eukprot:14285644-Alexandrium_andersonii.AAC.1